jgi:hypothetical protein
VNGPISSKKTTTPLSWILSITALCCKHFAYEIMKDEKGLFQQDSTTAYMARQNITFLKGMFPGHLIS